jgi:FkbM family methyltransferase
MKHPFKALFILLYRLGLFKNPKQIKVALPFNKRMFILIPEHVSVGIFLHGFHEVELTNTLSKIVSPGMCVVDIGAHFGYHSLLLSSLVGDSGHVHSFEPTKSTFKLLKKNCQEENNITLNNIAVFSKKDQLKFSDLGLLYTAFNSFNTNILGSDFVEKYYYLNSTSLDLYFKNKKEKPDFIKIDAERVELEILKGMKNILKNNKPIISMEVGDSDGKQLSKKCVSFLVDNGYESYHSDGNKLVKQPILHKYTHDNLIFIHPSRKDKK